MYDVPDLNSANAFVAASFSEYHTCVTSFEPLAAAAASAPDAFAIAVGAALSMPAQVLGGVVVAFGLALCFFGYALVRPANFAAGAYLGGTASLVLLNIIAPTLESCAVTVAVGTASGVVLGVLCALKRASVMAVLGLVAGEIVGDLFYKTFLAAVLPEYVAFGCIGFFAVLLGVLVAQLGDFAWKVGCAFFGAYLAITNFIKIVLVPYAPNGAAFLAFLAYKPDVPHLLAAKGAADRTTLVGSPYVYGPVIALAVLTAAGTAAQVAMLRASAKADLEMR